MTAATCTQDGLKRYTCDCGATYDEKIPATGHTVVTDAAIDATCTTEGKTEGSHCSVCDEVIVAQQTVAKLPHTYTPTIVTNATCEHKGVVRYTCVCGDSYEDDIPLASHTEVTDVAVGATCTTEGKTEGSHCSVCGQTIKEQQTVAKLPHTYIENVITKATCEHEGLIRYTCSCGASYDEKIEIKDHTEVTDAAVAATCMTEGKTEGSHCSVCGEVIVAQQTLPLADHDFVDGICSVCNDVETSTDGVELMPSATGASYVVTGYTGSDMEVLIASEYDGYPVTRIESGAFSGNTAITSVTIGRNIKEIGDNAFA